MGLCLVKPGAADPSEDPANAKKPENQKALPQVSATTLLRGNPVKEGCIDPKKLIAASPFKIQDVYNLERKKLGEGTYGSVCRGTHKTTGAVRAIKTIAKGKMRKPERFYQEIAIMKMMDHPSIIKLFETFEDQRNIYLAMELCSGGELFDRIISAGHFTEAEAATVMQQIMRAVFYMHERDICHRDLKPENFLFLSRDPIAKNVIKIIDFGLSCQCKAGDTLKTKAGTPYYVAPQVLQGKYDRMCDIWSCGVIMYILLCGWPPFHGGNEAEVLSRVKQGRVSFDAKEWKSISEDAKDLIKSLLRMNPKERPTAEQSLHHAWIEQKAPRASGKLEFQRGFMDNLRQFRSQNKLKKAALQIIAGQLSEVQIRGLRQTFQALDNNSDGLLTASELREGLQRAGLKIDPDLQEIVDGVDADGSGVIDYTEFLAATLDKRLYLQEDVCWTAFRVFDLDGDGKITQEELRKVLSSDCVNEVMGHETSAGVFKAVDCDGDGQIDFQEFMSMMRGSRHFGRAESGGA